MDTALLLILAIILFSISGILIVNVVIVSKQQKNDDIFHMIVYTTLIFSTIFFGLGFFYLILKAIFDNNTESMPAGLARVVSVLSGILIIMSLASVSYYSSDKYRKNMLSWEKQFFIMTNLFFVILGAVGFAITQ
jgi:ABC-type transport system involved in multi-copper enzyme maturation permease subunit